VKQPEMQNVEFKDSLKRIVQGYLGKAASTMFVQKALALIDDSADNKESFILASVRVSKRIAMFIDKDMSQLVYKDLMTAIEQIDAPQGTRRRYPRIPFSKKVRVRHNGADYELESDNLSQGGMYIKTRDPFPAGSEVEIFFALEMGSRIQLTGVVLYRRTLLDDTLKLPPGVAIEFKKNSDEVTAALQGFVERALR
jgi:uncharacterized protein (TIGR02266 family)